jgi:hypothetical protein
MGLLRHKICGRHSEGYRMNKKSAQPLASFLHAKTEQLPRSDKPPSIAPSMMLDSPKPDADVRLWMNYRECRLRQFTAGR